jgi:glycosyltransferase involved in cell wall biosynthesis
MKKKLFQTNSLEELVKIRGLEKYFNFKGYINNPFETISDCDIYIQLSRVTAPWSRSILESMSMGLPVMATGTYSEFVKNGENGFLYPYFDPKKIADDLVWCYENQSKMHKMGFRGRLIVKNKCDGKTYAQNISSIYSRLIG